MGLKAQVTRWKVQDGDVRSGILDVAAKYGTPMGIAPADNGYLMPADTTQGARNFIGVLTRDVVVGGPSYVERLTGVRNAPNEAGTAGLAGLELPDATGTNVTARMPEEMEVEGSDYLLTSGTGKLDAAGQSTAIPGRTEIGVIGGKFRIVTEPDQSVGLLVKKGLADEDGTTLRIGIRFY